MNNQPKQSERLNWIYCLHSSVYTLLFLCVCVDAEYLSLHRTLFRRCSNIVSTSRAFCGQNLDISCRLKTYFCIRKLINIDKHTLRREGIAKKKKRKILGIYFRK